MRNVPTPPNQPKSIWETGPIKLRPSPKVPQRHQATKLGFALLKCPAPHIVTLERQQIKVETKKQMVNSKVLFIRVYSAINEIYYKPNREVNQTQQINKPDPNQHQAPNETTQH